MGEWANERASRHVAPWESAELHEDIANRVPPQATTDSYFAAVYRSEFNGIRQFCD